MEEKKNIRIHALHAEITVDKQPNVKDSLVKDYGTFEWHDSLPIILAKF